MSGRLLIRADADGQIGTGHVMRTLALGQAWVDRGGEVTWAAAALPRGLRKRIAGEGITIFDVDAEAGAEADAAQTAARVREAGADRVVVDGYRFGADFQRVVRQAGAGLLVMDDNAEAGAFDCDWILNQNVHANEALYAGRAENAQLLLGPRYALLRREFRRYVGEPREIAQEGRRVLVTLGGGEHGAGPAVLAALVGIERAGLEVDMVIGTAGGGAERARAIAAEAGAAVVRVHEDVQDMTGLMMGADVAVAGAGSTSWELAMMGLPAVQVVVAENQRAIAEELHRRGIGWYLGEACAVKAEAIAGAAAELLGDADRRARMAEAGRKLVDGRGAERVATVLAASGKPMGSGKRELVLRPLDAGDVKDLFRWRNHPMVRENSLSTQEVIFEEHCRWFEGFLGDPGRVGWIAERGGIGVGAIRFDRHADGDWEVSITVDPDVHGQGLGREVLAGGLRQFAARRGGQRIIARIREKNEASIRLFRRQGFTLHEQAEGIGVYHYGPRDDDPTGDCQR